MLPPVTVMSEAAKVEDASDSVNVMMSVCPDRSDVDPARVMATVGSRVSKGIDRVLDAVLSFPAESVNFAPSHFLKHPTPSSLPTSPLLAGALARSPPHRQPSTPLCSRPQPTHNPAQAPSRSLLEGSLTRPVTATSHQVREVFPMTRWLPLFRTSTHQQQMEHLELDQASQFRSHFLKRSQFLARLNSLSKPEQLTERQVMHQEVARAR